MSGLRFVLLALALIAVSEQARVKIPTGDFNVEIYFVIDEKSLAPYMAEENNSKTKAKMSMTKDINYFLTEVNKLYSSLYQTKLEISVRELDFITGHAYQSKNIQHGKMIHEDSALKDFDNWLKQQGAQARLKYDIAVLFTGYNLANEKDDNTLGYAHVGAVCGEQNSGIVEYDATYATVVTTAHEIAHILGANHDSHKSSYVMAPSANHNHKDRWWFSLCSASNTWDVINSLKENCMLSTGSSSTVPNAAVTANLIDPNKMCKRAFDSNHYFSHYPGVYGDQVPAGDAVCKRFYCARRGITTVYPIFTSDGMPCAKAKTCKEGTCQSDPSSAAAAAVKDDKCVFGDSAFVSHSEISCSAAVAKYGLVSACFKDWFKTKCCDSYKSLNCAQFTDPSCKGNNPVKCANTATCIPPYWMCDKWDDCGDKWDESSQYCPTKKRGLVDILLDKSLDKSGMIRALESLKERREDAPVDNDDETPKTPAPEPDQGKDPGNAELRDTMA